MKKTLPILLALLCIIVTSHALENVVVSSAIFVDVPPAPLNVSASTGPLTSIQVTFTDNSDLETGYEIQHTHDLNIEFQSYTIPGGTTGSTITTLVKGYPHLSTVYVKVRAFRVDNGVYSYSPFSPIVSAVTDDIPLPPTNLVASTEGSTIKLTWSDNSTNEAAFILVRYVGDYNPNFSTPILLPANTTVYVDPSPEKNIRYTYRVQSIDVFEYAYPDHLFFTNGRFVETSAILKVAPERPTCLAGGTYSPSDILFAYHDNSDFESGYEVHYSTVSSTGPFTVDWTADGSPTEETNIGSFHGLDPNTTIYFKVRAVVFIDEGTETLFSEFSNLATVTTESVEPLEAPVADLASYVSPTGFQASWSDGGSDVSYYRLFVYSISDSTVLQGYDGLRVFSGLSYDVRGTKPYKRYAYYVKAVNEYTSSENSNIIRVTSIKNLTLRTVCSDDPAVYRRWKVINNNVVPVPILWRVDNTTQSGTHIAAIGESFFTTLKVSGLNKTTITWTDDEYMEHTSTKSSTYTPCDINDSMARTFTETEEESTLFKIEAYPNPIVDKFQISIASQTDKEVAIEIVNFFGQRVFTSNVTANTLVTIDASTYAKGIYILRANQLKNSRALKLVKQ
jgi:hypothetical protein